MHRRPLSYVVVSLISIALGCSLGAIKPPQQLWAQGSAGQWHCYQINSGGLVSDPEIKPIEFDISKFEAGLNQIAKQSPLGTVYSPPLLRDTPYVCVKH